jgi:hypothetical protein
VGDETNLVGVGEGAEGADSDGGGGGEEEEASAEVRRKPSHRLQLPPDAVAGASSPSASELHAPRLRWWGWGRVLSRPYVFLIGLYGSLGPVKNSAHLGGQVSSKTYLSLGFSL